ncbi:MAG: cellulose binding domain-containing protein [Planctomycetota bacterium]|nr:cellulose binding domain-containing protein [Planctomycetota bacterium]
MTAPLFCSGLLYGQHSIDYQMTAQWQRGYNADIVLRVDPEGASLDGWELSWMGTPEVLHYWNCEASESGGRRILEHVWYNETIQPGDSVVLGFTGVGDWPPSPMDTRINGVLIDVMIEGELMQPGDGPVATCVADLDESGVVNGEDLALVIAKWNTDDELADLDRSGQVDGADLTLLLSQWGECSPSNGDDGGSNEGDDDAGDDGGEDDGGGGDDGHGGDDDHGDGGGHDDPCMGEFTDITCWGDFHGSNNNSHAHELVGGRTAITTEAMIAYNNLRAFLGLPALELEDVGQWAFDESLTNNSQAWGNDLLGVGLYYAMQGAKVGWITDDAYRPQLLADIQRTARLVEDPDEMRDLVMDMVRENGIAGYADYLEQNGMVETFINTIKMEPHYGGWMHGRTHGFRSIEGVAINHDINHLTVLSWDQMQPFMNDTFDWPQWNALDVSDSGVIEYYQSMVVLGDPVGDNM